MQITSRSGAIAVKTFYDYDVASFMCNTIYTLYYMHMSVCVCVFRFAFGFLVRRLDCEIYVARLGAKIVC